LVGPNASGKTTFLDVPAFLGRLVSDGLDAAIAERTQNFQDLLWQCSGDGFELAIEANIPEEFRRRPRSDTFDIIRYEVSLKFQYSTAEIALQSEKVLLMPALSGEKGFGFPPDSIITKRVRPGGKTIIRKTPQGSSTFYSESTNNKNPFLSLKLEPQKSALGNLPADKTIFPVSTWLRQLLSEGIRSFMLDGLEIRKASKPGQGRNFTPNGSNLPWIIESLIHTNPERMRDWIRHLQTALPDLEDIRTVERSDDRHRYLMLKYDGGLEVPSWMLSDGTLRLLALTLPAYMPDLQGMFLVEEPENGIHPQAIETVFQSLSSVYEAQVILATHSPVILSVVEPENVLCFTKLKNGATSIVQGDRHPVLRDWRGETNLGALFASGVLG